MLEFFLQLFQILNFKFKLLLPYILNFKFENIFLSFRKNIKIKIVSDFYIFKNIKNL